MTLEGNFSGSICSDIVLLLGGRRALAHVADSKNESCIPFAFLSSFVVRLRPSLGLSPLGVERPTESTAYEAY